MVCSLYSSCSHFEIFSISLFAAFILVERNLIYKRSAERLALQMIIDAMRLVTIGTIGAEVDTRDFEANALMHRYVITNRRAAMTPESKLQMYSLAFVEVFKMIRNSRNQLMLKTMTNNIGAPSLR